jgi:hypothetical protein
MMFHLYSQSFRALSLKVILEYSSIKCFRNLVGGFAKYLDVVQLLGKLEKERYHRSIAKLTE